MTVFSVCIATIPGRESLLSRLLWTLEPQLMSGVEVLIHTHPTKPLGQKTNEMWEAARGGFVARVDDDDLVSSEYVFKIMMQFVQGNADYVGFNVLYTVDGHYVNEYPHDWRRGANDPGAPIRAVSPIMVVPKFVALKYKHGNERMSDFEWSQAVHRGYKPINPVYIDKVLYHYDHWPQYSLPNTPDGVQRAHREVGQWPYDRTKFTWME